MKDSTELAELATIVKQRQLEIALQAFADHAPWPVDMAVAWIKAFTGGDHKDTVEMLSYACANDHLELWRGDHRITEEDTGIEVCDSDEIRLGANWRPVPESLGIRVAGVVVDKSKAGRAAEEGSTSLS